MKFVSNKQLVVKSVPEEDRASDSKTLNLTLASKAEERALGVLWYTEGDELGFKMANKEKPSTRRGILSTISSIFDPLGFIAPVLMKPKILLQQLCRLNLAWDDILSEDAERSWTSWFQSMHSLTNFRVLKDVISQKTSKMSGPVKFITFQMPVKSDTVL